MTTTAPSNPNHAKPEVPLLASSLLTDKDLDGILASVLSVSNHRTTTDKTNYLTTGLGSLDAAALSGGLEPGRVVEIAGAGVGAGVSEIYKALLVSFLVRADGQEAVVVDTTGNFDVLGLYGLLVARLKGSGESGVEAKAAKMLERVKIMRVFDFEGVREAVGEIKGAVDRKSEKKKKEEGEVRDELRDEVMAVDEAQAAGQEEKPKRTYVADSEDEDNEEEEMLFESETKDISAEDTPGAEKRQRSVPSDMREEGTTENDASSTLRFILIDNLTQVVGPLLKNDLTQGTLQTTTLLSTLANLTHTHALHTILITPTTPPRPASPKRPVPIQATEPLQQEREIPPPPLSIFSSNKATAMPALSALMGLYADVRLVVSRVPKRRGDARLYYNDESGTGRRKGETVCVLEVAGDRFGTRMGGWGVFGEGGEKHGN